VKGTRPRRSREEADREKTRSLSPLVGTLPWI
jgi:hypothetical protein